MPFFVNNCTFAILTTCKVIHAYQLICARQLTMKLSIHAPGMSKPSVDAFIVKTESQSGFPLFHWKNPELSRTPMRNFPGPFRAQECLNIKKKHHLLTTFGV